MKCLDETTFVRLQDGALAPAELVKVQRHLDQCPTCFQQAVLLGRLRAEDPSTERRADNNDLDGIGPSPRCNLSANGHNWANRQKKEPCTVALLALLIAHAFLSASAVRWFWDAGSATLVDVRCVQTGQVALDWTISTYALIWGSLGFVLGSIALAALMAGCKWASSVVRVYSVLSMPSVLLVPNSLLVLSVLEMSKCYPNNSEQCSAISLFPRR